jgi:protein-ribulosamine 3-kinase
MVHGEYESMKMLHSTSPEMVPKPIDYGTFKTDPDTHFFLCQFVDLYDELPDIVDFCRGVAELHHRSMGKSPENKFGFHVTTCNGTVPQDNTWSTSWEAFYIQSLKHEFALEAESQGTSPEIDALLPALYEKVCPRLLRPLETEGRRLQPCLVHGDLWDGNVAVDRSGKPYIYDASAFWGHNEYEMTMWRGERYKMRTAFRKEYFNHFKVSPPAQDEDDRNLLYSLRADLHDSILFRSTTRFREALLVSLRELVEKFPDGYQGEANRRDMEATGAGSEGPMPGGRENEDNRSTNPTNPGLSDMMNSMGLNDPYLLPSGIVFGERSNRPDSGYQESLSGSLNYQSVRFGESALSPSEGSLVDGASPT